MSKKKFEKFGKVTSLGKTQLYLDDNKNLRFQAEKLVSRDFLGKEVMLSGFSEDPEKTKQKMLKFEKIELKGQPTEKEESLEEMDDLTSEGEDPVKKLEKITVKNGKIEVQCDCGHIMSLNHGAKVYRCGNCFSWIEKEQTKDDRKQALESQLRALEKEQ